MALITLISESIMKGYASSTLPSLSSEMNGMKEIPYSKTTVASQTYIILQSELNSETDLSEKLCCHLDGF